MVCNSPKAGALLIPLISISINALYPLRIIGLNQDEKASGGMAGLTFMFDGQGIGTSIWRPNSSGDYPQSDIYQFTNGEGLSNLPNTVLSNIVTVKKWTANNTVRESGYNAPGFSANADTLTWKNSSERLFLLSLLEVAPHSSAHSNTKYALGSNGDERYLAMAEGSGFEHLNGTGGGSSSWLRDTVCASNGDGTYLRGIFNTTSVWSDLSYRSHSINPGFCF